LSRLALAAFGVGVAAACGGSSTAGIGPDDDAGGLGDARLTNDAGRLKGGVNCVDGPDYTGCACSGAEQKVCYTGPPSTLGVAPCAPGVQRCVATQEAQYAYGPCEGEVLPTAAAACDGTTRPDDAGVTGDSGDSGGIVVDLDAGGSEDVVFMGAYGGSPLDASSMPPYGHVPFDAGTPDAEEFDVDVPDTLGIPAYGGFPGH
jgi:hypothetical protein